jgi:hypothetical protein
METFVSICLGIGLSAACGFRVFVPLLAASAASLSGHLTLGSSFDWLGTYPALICLGVATVAEVAAYYIPWLDHLLDTIATPAAVVAGTLLTAALVKDMSPMMKWTLALIAGGGIAGAVQGGTVLLRGASTAATGGFANPIFATIELGGSAITSLVSLATPVIAAAIVLILLLSLSRKILRLVRQRRPSSATETAGIKPVGT